MAGCKFNPIDFTNIPIVLISMRKKLIDSFLLIAFCKIIKMSKYFRIAAGLVPNAATYHCLKRRCPSSLVHKYVPGAYCSNTHGTHAAVIDSQAELPGAHSGMHPSTFASSSGNNQPSHLAKCRLLPVLATLGRRSIRHSAVDSPKHPQANI